MVDHLRSVFLFHPYQSELTELLLSRRKVVAMTTQYFILICVFDNALMNCTDSFGEWLLSGRSKWFVVDMSTDAIIVLSINTGG